MKTQKDILNVTFSGNVVEIHDCNDGACAKVLLHPGYFNVNINDMQEMHLGDQLEIDCEVKIIKMIPTIGTIDQDREE